MDPRKHAEYLARVARLKADPDAAPHGRSSTYDNWGCRCIPCSRAKSTRNARRHR